MNNCAQSGLNFNNFAAFWSLPSFCRLRGSFCKTKTIKLALNFALIMFIHQTTSQRKRSTCIECLKFTLYCVFILIFYLQSSVFGLRFISTLYGFGWAENIRSAYSADEHGGGEGLLGLGGQGMQIDWSVQKLLLSKLVCQTFIKWLYHSKLLSPNKDQL